VTPASSLNSCKKTVVNLAFLFFCTLATNLHAGAVAQLLATGQTGAQTFLNKNVGYFWKFTTSDTTSFQEITATFTLKRGPNTVEDVTFKIVDSMNLIIGERSLAASSGSQSFTPYVLSAIRPGGGTAPYNPEFKFSTDGSLKTYYLTLTTISPSQSETWFIKNDAQLTLSGVSGTPSPRGSFDPTVPNKLPDGGTPDPPPPPPPPVPEPASLAVWGLACLGLAGAKRRLGLKKLTNS